MHFRVGKIQGVLICKLSFLISGECNFNSVLLYLIFLILLLFPCFLQQHLDDKHLSRFLDADEIVDLTSRGNPKSDHKVPN